MTPAQVDELDDVTYTAFVRFMNNEAAAIEKASRKAR